MSFHQHIHELNNLCSRLEILVDRAGQCAGSIGTYTGTPAISLSDTVAGPPSSLNAGIVSVVGRLSAALECLNSNIADIESAVIDSTPTSTPFSNTKPSPEQFVRGNVRG